MTSLALDNSVPMTRSDAPVGKMNAVVSGVVNRTAARKRAAALSTMTQMVAKR